MPLSRPDNPPIVNESVATSLSSGFSIDESQTKINQLHGIAANNTIGAGIPKQVSNAQVSIANASTGSTCTASILFKSDPTDKSLSGINVWVKGYQGNSNPVLVGSGTSSPTKIVLNNTGEIVTFIIQAFGNGGNAPFSQAPTCSGTLPKSTAGGFGSATVVSPPSVSGSATAGQLAKFAAPPTTVTGADLTGDVTTAGSVATTVGKIQGIPVVSGTPILGDILLYEGTSWTPDRLFQSLIGYRHNFGTTSLSTVVSFGGGTATASTGFASPTDNVATATEPETITHGTSSSASTVTNGIVEPIGNSTHTTLGILQRFSARLHANQTTNARYWIGLHAQDAATNPTTNATYLTDTPNTKYVAFRYSATTDAVWKAVCGTASGSQTVVSTGVAVDTTNTQLFEITWDGTNVNFYINRVLVAQISTNVPATSQRLGMMCLVDNKATANAATFTWAYMFRVSK